MDSISLSWRKGGSLWEQTAGEEGRGAAYGLKDAGAGDVDVRHVAEGFPRDGNEGLQVGPLRDVAFGEDDVLRGRDVGGGFGGEAQVGDDAFGAVGGGEAGEG